MFIAILFGAVVSATDGNAQPSQAHDLAAGRTLSIDSFSQRETTVKGVRRDRPVAEIAQKTEIVTRKDIESTPATDLVDLMKKTSGVDVIQYPGLLSGVGMRGFRPQYSGLNQRTLLLVDGHPAGATNLASVGLNDVERIEVLKGPSSALFGPLAMGGVINVVTAKSVAKPYVELGMGSFGKTDGSFGIGRRDSSTGVFWDVVGRAMNQSEDHRIGRSHILRDVFGWDKNVPTTSTGAAKIDSGDGSLRASTGYRETQGSASLGWSRGAWYLRARSFIYDAPSVESPGSLAKGNAGRSTKNVERYGADLLARTQFGSHAITLQCFRSREYSEDWNSGAAFHYYDNTNDWAGAQLRDNITIGSASLTAGTDWNVREFSSAKWSSSTIRVAPNYPDYAIQDVAGYAEASAKFWNGLLVPTAGVRYDLVGFETRVTEKLPGFHPDTRWFNVFSPSAGIASLLPGGVRGHASFGHGFVTPDAFQVAGHSVTVPNSAKPHQVAVTRGNGDLDPESNWSIDGGLGIERPEFGLSLDATFFGNFVEDKIVSKVTRATGTELGFVDGDTIKSVTRYANADDATYKGLELSGSWDLSKPLAWRWGVRLFGNSTIFTAIEETSSGVTSDALNVGTNWMAGVEVATPEKACVRLATRYIGRRKDTDWNDPTYPVVRYPAFLVTDVAFLVPVVDGTRLSFSVNNLTDENYYEKSGYNMPGRNWRLSLRREF